jgi:Mg-chelatase subunit ChlD
MNNGNGIRQMSESSKRPSGSSHRPSALVLVVWLTLTLLAGNSRAEDPQKAIPAGTYAEAMKWLDGELTTVADGRPLLIVWLLDESQSMSDDRHEAAQIMHTLYESWGDKSETVVVSFGARVHEMTSKPETSLAKIRTAFDRAPMGESGKENMCMAVISTVEGFAQSAKTTHQQMVIITLTDESPSDSGDTMSEPGQLEQTVQRCRKAKVPVYVLGREAIFGFPYATIRWKDPVYQLNHWVWITRGPDTTLPERLRWTGLGTARDNYPSGFGPHSQERLCRETGGGFFVLQQPASIKGFNTRRLAMVGYEPDLISRREAEEVTARSRFRTACDTIIRTLNPGTDPQLNLRESHFSVDPDEFFTQAVGEFEKTGHAWAKLSKAIEELEEVRNLREAEPSKRWRANYDLLYAQCRAYRAGPACTLG